MKKLLIIFILLILTVPAYIGVHGIVYNNEYKELATLKAKLYQDKLNMAEIDSIIKNDKVKSGEANPLIKKFGGETQSSAYEEIQTNIKLTYEKDKARIDFLEEKVALFKFIK